MLRYFQGLASISRSLCRASLDGSGSMAFRPCGVIDGFFNLAKRGFTCFSRIWESRDGRLSRDRHF